MLNYENDIKQIEGWLTDNEALTLYNIAKTVPKDSKIVE